MNSCYKCRRKITTNSQLLLFYYIFFLVNQPVKKRPFDVTRSYAQDCHVIYFFWLEPYFCSYCCKKLPLKQNQRLAASPTNAMDFNVKKLASGAGLFFTRAVQVFKRCGDLARASFHFACQLLRFWLQFIFETHLIITTSRTCSQYSGFSCAIFSCRPTKQSCTNVTVGNFSQTITN